jgi:catechol 2,3-dioxygenase-like lactoylglutathione lyase family enzyme
VTAHWWHVGITVGDIDRSLTFYRDIVGMHVQSDDLHVNDMTRFDALTNNSGSELRVAWLNDGHFTLQLIQYLAAGGDRLELRHNNIGSPHLSFFVEDADAKYEELRARGDVPLLCPVIQLGPTSRTFYAADPDGLPVEFFCQQQGSPNVVPPNWTGTSEGLPEEGSNPRR